MVDSHFTHAFADGAYITGISERQTPGAGGDSRSDL
jgi:hypothetical protein